MGNKKKKKIDLDNLKPEEKLKYEIAQELGYLDKVMQGGWESLTAKESGRIGGILARKKREAARAQEGKAEARTDTGMDARTDARTEA